MVFPRATQIKTYSWGNAQVALVGNKVDLEEDRQVPTEDAQRLATELGQHTHTHTQFFITCSARTKTSINNHTELFFLSLPSPGFQFLEASAKDNINVKQVFDNLVDAICEKMSESPNGDASPSANDKGANLKETPRSSQGGCC